MARKIVDNKTWTKINTDQDNFLIQNISGADVGILVQAGKPADTVPYDVVIAQRETICHQDIKGIVWARTITDASGIVSCLE